MDTSRKKQPQLQVNIDFIELDHKNPRLVPYLSEPDNANQFDLTSILYEHFDTEVIAMSMVENGYFDEEPLILVPKKKPDGFNFSDYTKTQDLVSEIKKLIKKELITFTVVEGNRRVATIKLITDYELRKKLNIDKYYPKTIDPEKIDSISNIPCIIYEKRKDVSAYLGVRHIAGLLKWEAFAQAAYTADIIKQELAGGNSINDAVEQVQKVVGDRSDKLRKQYVTYKLYEQARDDLFFNVKPIINKFSLLKVAYNSPAIREFIGAKKYSEVDLNADVIPPGKLDHFKDLLTWIFGSDKERPVLTDSRKITSILSHVVQSEEAVEHLKDYGNIEEAYELTSGEREFLSRKLKDAFKSIQLSLKFAYKYKNQKDLLKQVSELEELVKVLKDNLSK